MAQAQLEQIPYSKKSSEFQQAPKVDESLQYVPKKALPEIVITPGQKEHRLMAAFILETMKSFADIHDDRVSKGVMSPVQLG
ncbi:MAG: hypothetical protein KGH63_04615 [Candidatus Micrarchaeota archaeon]|nr:hypothetical protein [Candidatus Micrarchaeota archaeon]